MAYFSSGSTYSKAHLCPGSTALPHGMRESPKADVGSAIHESLALRASHGLKESFERLPQICADWELSEDDSRIVEARLRAFTFMPPEGAVPELPLALLDDGRVVRVEGARSVYKAPENAILPITIDLIWAEPYPLIIDRNGRPRCPEDSVLWAIDYKSGRDEYVDPIEHNRQGLLSGLTAARYTGARRFVPGIVFVRRGQGDWDTPRDAAGDLRVMSQPDLDWLEDEVRETHRVCQEQSERYAQGLPVKLVEGLHCGWCGARERCPAKLAMIRSVVTGELVVPFGAALPLTAAHIAQLAVIKPQLQRFLQRVDEVLKPYVDQHGPVSVGEGRVYGPHEVEQDEIDAESALPIIEAEIGAEFAAKAVTPARISKKALDAAIKESLEARGVKRQGAATGRRVYGGMLKSGAMRKVTVVKYETFKLEVKAQELPPSPSEEPPAAPQQVDMFSEDRVGGSAVTEKPPQR